MPGGKLFPEKSGDSRPLRFFSLSLRNFFLVTIIGSAAGVSRLGSGARQRKPNILLILGDDLGLTDVGRYGGKLIRTQRGSLQGGKTPLRVRLSTMQRGWYLSGMIS
jgi:hypothetical protein